MAAIDFVSFVCFVVKIFSPLAAFVTNNRVPDAPANSSSLIPYQTEDGQTRVQCRFENGTVWLTQALMAISVFR